MNLSYGSRGDEVKRLQTALNSQGYGLSVDGIYCVVYIDNGSSWGIY